MKKEYPVILNQIETRDGLEWEARFPDVPGVVGGGKTRAEALADAEDNLNAHLAFLSEDGIAAPPASDLSPEPYSGCLSLRLPKSLHEKVAFFARKEGVSINSFIGSVLAEKTGELNVISTYQRIMETIPPILVDKSWVNAYHHRYQPDLKNSVNGKWNENGADGKIIG